MTEACHTYNCNQMKKIRVFLELSGAKIETIFDEKVKQHVMYVFDKNNIYLIMELRFDLFGNVEKDSFQISYQLSQLNTEEEEEEEELPFINSD